MSRKVLICLLLAGLTLAVYWPAAHFAVVYYDDTFFTDNPQVQSGLNWQSLAWALTSAVAANWHPVTTLSFVLTHQFFGTNAGAEHLVNVAFHALNGVLLFLVLAEWAAMPARRFVSSGLAALESGDKSRLFPGATHRADQSAVLTAPSKFWRCAVVAALFAWHPLRVESVAWIAERKDVMCGFFLLLTLWAWGRYALKTAGGAPVAGSLQPPEGKGRTFGHFPSTSLFYWLALLFFALALLSKAMAVTLPFLLLLLDVWPLARITEPARWRVEWKKLLLEKWPFFALSGLFCLVTFLVQRHSDATPSLQQLGLGLRFENILVSYLRYLGWSFWPAHLAMFYSFPYDDHFYLALWPGWLIGAGALLLAGISVLCVQQLARRPYLAVGWFWYLGMMVPVIGFVQVGSQGMADRYTYLPMIGPVISLVWLVSESLRSRPLLKALSAILIAVALAASLRQTRYQLQFWRNTTTLSQHTIDVTGENPRAEYILGLGLEQAGDLPQAIVHYRNAMTSQPRVLDAFYAMGRLYGQQGQWALAEAVYASLLSSNPDDFNSHLGLVTVLPHLGREAEAGSHLQAALRSCPNEPDALNNLAWTLATSGITTFRDGPRAVELARRACELTGYRETVMVGTLGAAYAEAGQFDEAIATAQTACALASASAKTDLLKINQQLLATYRQHQPYHEAANP